MKKILLAIFICLFANAVDAGEAWVLWEHNRETGGHSEWIVLAAYPEYKQCIERQKKDFEIIKKMYPSYELQVLSPETVTFKRPTIDYVVSEIHISLRCLPDTIDPRK